MVISSLLPFPEYCSCEAHTERDYLLSTECDELPTRALLGRSSWEVVLLMQHGWEEEEYPGDSWKTSHQ